MKRLLSVWSCWLRKSDDRASQAGTEPRYGWNGTPIAKAFVESPSDPMFDSLNITQAESAEGMPESDEESVKAASLHACS
jgi:hypothetical protein